MPRKPPPAHARFKPGQSGNPAGRPKLPESLRAVAEMTVDEIKRVMAKYMRMNRVELQAAIADQTTPAFELLIASGIAQGIKSGDYSRMAFLLERTIGKVKDESAVEFTGSLGEALEQEEVPIEAVVSYLKARHKPG